MNEDGENHVRDRLSNLPESLLCHLLLNLPTKDVVKCSVLSSRWRNLWKYVPGLDLKICNFRDRNSLVSFVDSFLRFNTESLLQSFRLTYGSCEDGGKPEIGLISRWINTVVDRKVKHIDVVDYSDDSWDIQILSNIYTFKFADNLALETLISQCPVLENLTFERCLSDDTEVLRVRSQSLLSFTLRSDSAYDVVGDTVVAIDAPRLKYLHFIDDRTASFILNNPYFPVEADIDAVFNLSYGKMFDPNDMPKRNMIRNFLAGISSIKKLIIASITLEVIYHYSRCEPLPLFRNLSFLRVGFYGYKWEMLPNFLQSCPNLKSLVVGAIEYQEDGSVNIFPGPRGFLSSLEYVEMERPLKGDAMEMELVRYLLEKSTILKKLTLCLDNSIKKEESVILKKLLTIPRLSSSCQVVVL